MSTTKSGSTVSCKNGKVKAYIVYTTSSTATTYTVKVEFHAQVVEKTEASLIDFGLIAVDYGNTFDVSRSYDNPLSKGDRTVATKTKTIEKGTSSKTVKIDWRFGASQLFEEPDPASRVQLSLTVPALASYTVSYNANGGSGAPGSQTKYHGKDLKLSTTKPTRIGYTFKGWSTSKTATTATYAAGATFTTNAATTLYAVWAVNKYTISYNANGGTQSSSAASSYPIGTTKTTRSYNTAGDLINTTTFGLSRTGYHLVDGKEWNRAANGSGTSYDHDVSYSWSTFGSTSAEQTNVTLYANWVINTYKLTYNANGGSVSPASKTLNHGDAYGTLPTPTRTGYNFLGWYTAASGGTKVSASTTISANTTIYAHWSVITYTVAYNANGGSGAPSSQTKTYGTNLTLSSTVPTRSGYRFLGWATSASGSVAYQPGGTYSANAAVTLYAKWQQTYFAPTISNLIATRAKLESGTYSEDDEGSIAHIRFTWAAGSDDGTTVTPSQCQVGISEKGANSWTWTTITLSQSPVSAYVSSPVLSTEKEYDIKVKFTVTGWSDVVKATYISKAYFIIDVSEDGSGIAFGMSSSRDGFECNMDVYLGIPKYQTSGTDDKALYDAIHALNWDTGTNSVIV